MSADLRVDSAVLDGLSGLLGEFSAAVERARTDLSRGCAGVGDAGPLAERVRGFAASWQADLAALGVHGFACAQAVRDVGVVFGSVDQALASDLERT